MEPRRGILPEEEECLVTDTSAESIYKCINRCTDLRVKENGEIVIVVNRRKNDW